MGRRRQRFNARARAGVRPKTTDAETNDAESTLPQNEFAVEPFVPAETAPQEDSEPQYSASATSVPEMLLPKAMQPSATAFALPDPPTGKMTAKKRKRLEKFIERELKKDERAKLFAKLSQNWFDSDLLMSSKDMGRSKRSRSGNSVSANFVAVDSNDGLSDAFVDMDGDFDHDLDEHLSDADGNQNDHEEESVGDMDASLALGIVARAFGSQKTADKPLVPTVFTSMESGTTVEEAPTTSVASKMIAFKPIAGSALRQPANNSNGVSNAVSDASNLSKRQIKRRQKNEAKRIALEKETVGRTNHSSESDSSSDDDDDNHDDQEIVQNVDSVHKDMWASDVVAGEKLPSIPSIPATTSKPSAAPKPSEKTTINTTSSEKAYFVPVHRSQQIQAARLKLPVVGEEQPIMESILANDVTILCGETGSGKTTQVPQFLYEVGFGDPSHVKFPGMIGVTQPRRVAAVSMARRVADEMNLHDGQVAYQIRYDRGLTNDKTRIKFMTDGILLRELSNAVAPDSTQPKKDAKLSGNGILLLNYSCIIIDEAHERTVGTDVLIGWLTRIVRLRNSGAIPGVLPLKLVIMSATLRVQDFTENQSLFPTSVSEKPSTTNASKSTETSKSSCKPPVIKVEGRQHKVVIHYNKRTPEIDYVTEAYKKVCKIHTRLPPGGVLVFVTGQNEVQMLVRKLQNTFQDDQKNPICSSESTNKSDSDQNGSDAFDGVFGESEVAGATIEPIGSADAVEMETTTINGIDDYDQLEEEEEEETTFLGATNADENDDDDELLAQERSFVPPTKAGPVHVLPLYSLLPTQAQMRVFEPPPSGSRLVVVATNVAETSLTIPGIRYVVDCGKVKDRRFDSFTGVQTFQISWTSKASADQRAGRAGRLGPGHCYRLFSSAVFNDYFESFSKPEILKVPIEDVVLQMKSIGINQVVKFPFPTPPSSDGLHSAERLLKFLGAIEASEASATDLGRLMAKLPVLPRFSKMLIVAARQTIHVLPYAIALVAGMSVGDPFIRDHDLLTNNQPQEDDDDDLKEQRRKERSRFYKIMQMFSGKSPSSDELRMLNAIGAYAVEYGKTDRRTSSLIEFCQSHFLRHKAMEEIMKLRAQLTNLVRTVMADDPNSVVCENVKALSVDFEMPPPSAQIQALLRQMLLAGAPDKVARLNEAAVSGFGKHAMPVYETMWGGSVSGNDSGEHFLIHPSSCLYSVRPAPKWIVYSEVVGKEERIASDNSEAIQMRSSSNQPVKRWLKGCSVLNEAWISAVCPPTLVRTGKLLEQPEPHFDAQKDAVVGFVLPSFGPKSWELGLTETRQLEASVRAAWFGRALLEGSVNLRLVESNSAERKNRKLSAQQDLFGILGSWMQTKPSVVTKPWARTQTKVQRLLDALIRSGVSSRGALADRWAGNASDADRNFLLEAVLLWVPQELHAPMRQNWPPVLPGSRYNERLHKAVAETISLRSDLDQNQF